MNKSQKKGPSIELILSLLLIASPLSIVVLFFAQGFTGGYNFFLASFAMLASLVLFCFSGARLLWLLFTRSITSLRPIYLVCGLGIFVFLVSYLLPFSTWFLYGFRAGIVPRLTEGQWLQTAQVIREIVPINEQIIIPRFFGREGNPENAELWTKLMASSAAHKLPEAFAAYHFDDRVELRWGNGLVGHYGIRLAEDPQRQSSDFLFMQVSPHIAVYHLDH